MATFGTYVSGQILTAAELNAGLPLCVLENAAVTLTNGVNTYIPFTTEIVDALGWHSNATNTSRITPNIAGTYLVTLVINNVSGTTRALTGLSKNGSATNVPIFMDTPGTIDDFTVTGYVTANGTTDYFEQQALVTGATLTTVKAQFSMQRIAT
jgi:hypothetical protein